MSRVKTIVTLIAIVLVSIFAVQNYEEVIIKFLVYNISVSQALIIVLSAAIGVVIGLIVGLNSSFKANKNAKELSKSHTETQKKSTQLEEENKKLLVQIGELQAQVAELSAPKEAFNSGVDSLDI